MKLHLVILAAGMGSRYGGLKQLDRMKPVQASLLEYTIYDAVQSGFEKIICIIRKDMEADFIKMFEEGAPSRVPVSLVFQDELLLPDNTPANKKRSKPWGTAHALLAARPEITGPFAMVNADDFYGRDAIALLGEQLRNSPPAPPFACCVGYQVKNTLSPNGSVSRGICSIDPKNQLLKITERACIKRNEEGEICYFEEGKTVQLPGETLVSMNLIGFTPAVFRFISEGFQSFYARNHLDKEKEYYIADVLERMIKAGCSVRVLPTEASWFGITYRQDKPNVEQELKKLHKSGKYPNERWG